MMKTEMNEWEKYAGGVPATEAQKGVYLECAEEPDSVKYNIVFTVKLPAKTDLERFAAAVGSAVLAHPSLYSRFAVTEEGVRLYPGKPEFFLSRTRADGADAAKKAFIRPFDLQKGPLCRFELCETPEGMLFLFDVHHLLFDGTSVGIFFEDIAAAYEGREILPEEMSLFAYAEKENGSLKDSPAYREAQEFFREKLEKVEFDPALYPDVAFPEGEKGTAHLILKTGEDLSDEVLARMAGGFGVSKGSVFMTAFAYTLSRFTGGESSSFCSVSGGRRRDKLSRTTGMFVKTLPLYFEIKDTDDIAGTARRVQEEFYGAVRNDCISFGELAKAYGVSSAVSFLYQSDRFNRLMLDGEVLYPEETPLDDNPSDFLCEIYKIGGGFEIHVKYRRKLFTAACVKNITETFLSVLRGMAACGTFGEIPLVNSGQQAFLDAVNATAQPFDENETLGRALEKMIEKQPERTALVYEDRSLSFAQLGRKTAALAAYLAGKGIGKDDFVGILLPRNDEAVLAIWAVIRAGAAAAALDGSYPAERLNYMVKDCGAKLLITDRKLRPILTEYTGPVLYTDEWAALPEAPAFRSRDEKDGAAALIYTSGTTGKPKGSILEDRNLVAFCHSYRKTMEVDETARVANYASFGFDAGLMDITGALTNGAALYVIPDELRLDLSAVEAFFLKNGITHTMMTTQVGRMFAEETKCPTLRTMMVGGEKLVPFKPQAYFRFINGYGPCETMAYICSHAVTDNSKLQPIGRPAMNVKLYVVDKQGRLVPPGAVGELCIAGLQVGRGYLGQPEKTAAAFVANPFTEEKGYERLYKTGDVVRLLPTGEFDFIGRRDGQVKIRGFRVELTEVEEVVRRFAGITDATVTAFEEPGGGKALAAYVCSNETVDGEALKAFIRAEKPAYMVPAVVMQLEKIPYTQNQKVNRRALPVPERKKTERILPENETQKTVFALAAGILGHEDLDIVTDLFDAGLSSIGALKLNVQLGRTFGLAMKIADLKENPTVKALAALVEAAGAAETYAAQEDYPLLQNQIGVYLESGSDGKTLRYNVPALFRLSDKLDADRLQNAVKAAIDAHPYLKAKLFVDAEGNARVCRNDEAEAAVDLILTETLPAETELLRPFTLLNERLYRAEIYETKNGNYLFLDVHHLLTDGTSMGILLKDVSAAYQGKISEKESFTGYELTLEEQKLLADKEKTAAAENYFDTLLSGCNTECLPEKCPEPDAKPGDCAYFNASFGDASAHITAFCEKRKLSANAFFNAVFGYVLAEFLHSDDVTYCTVYNGRNDSRLTDCVAMLVKTLPVRCFTDRNADAAEFAAGLQKQLLDSMAHDLMPFADVSRKHGVKPDIFFNYQGSDFSFDEIGGEKAEMLPLSLTEAKAPLSAEVFLEKGTYRVLFTYQPARFCREFVTSFASAMRTAAEGFTKAEKLGQIPLLSEEEKACFVRMNDTAQPLENIPAHALFERQAAAHPDRIAVKTASRSLTYAELKDRSDRVAQALLALGVQSDEILGMILDRSDFVPAAEIGIMKAGAAFLPMLPTYPDERLEFCMTDAGCRYVVTTEDILRDRPELFSGSRPWRALSLKKLLEGTEGQLPLPAYDPHRLVYCIYTSGSTGTPKGVMLEHHNLTNFVQLSAISAMMERGSAIFAMASISFDMSLSDLFLALCRGKTVYIGAEAEIHDLDRLLTVFTENKIDLLITTPSFAWSLLSLPAFEGAMANLKGVVLGAEAFQPTLYAKLKTLNQDMLILNGYGPTECTQSCSAKVLHSGEHITIGGPMPNTAFLVSDEKGNLLPRYAVGELLIGGEGVCRGYVKLPEKNAASFLTIDGVRFYRSGDLVRINREGEAEFGGRKDNQVKLRGFRVELDEVETVMQEYPGVTQSKVIVRNNGTEDFLAGFYTADKTVEPEALTEFLKTKLTYYMVPAALMQLEKMPLTPNGKLDKKALPEVKPVKKARQKRAPKQSLEAKIAELFRSVLNLDEVYVDDNFFEIGGTSLSASKLVMQLKGEGYKLEYQDIFDHQSAAELAEYLESRERPAEKKSGGLDKTVDYQDEAVAELLKYNSMEYAKDVKREPLGDVLLTGATGFLGIHILKQLLDTESGRIYCLMRKSNYSDLEKRLKAMLVYYFEDDCAEAFGRRIFLLEGDITDENLAEQLKNVSFDTLFNCAASVKHYAMDNSIEFINVHGVENLIGIAKEKKARMIQISTTSVPGAHNDETYRINLKMPENRLFVIDDMNNQYCQSKYKAELKMLEAIKDGMSGKIIRVGNLMGRYSDGEFQTNMRTNAFLNGLRGFVNIGKCPISHATDPMSFSPVDLTARAAVLLAGTNDMFTAFHADSRFIFDEMMLIEAVNRCGISIRPVPDEEYYADFNRMMADPALNEKVSGLLTNDRPDLHLVNTDNTFTANVLYRLGFSWPFVDNAYLEKVITSLDTLDFFEN